MTRLIQDVLRTATLRTALGLAFGIPVALVCVPFVKAELYEISHADGAVVGASMAVLVAAACVAGVIPARRAASIDPVQALRME